MADDTELRVPGQRFSASMQAASARRTWGAAGPGDWVLDVTDARSVYAGIGDGFPDGVIEVAGTGRLAFELSDVPGWHPVIALGGDELAARTVATRIAYGWDGAAVLYRDQPGAWDAALGRTVALGPQSDGSLAAAGMRGHVIVTVGDGQDWRFGDCLIGWTQLG